MQSLTTGRWPTSGEKSEISLFTQKKFVSSSIKGRTWRVMSSFLSDNLLFCINQSAIFPMNLIHRNYISSLLEQLLSLPADSSFPSGYVSRFNEKIQVLISTPNYYYDMLSFYMMLILVLKNWYLPIQKKNPTVQNITSDTRFKDLLRTFFNANSTVNSLLKFM